MNEKNYSDFVSMIKDVENWMIKIWEGIFNKQNIQADADFFSLGGNSLTALRFLAEVEKQFGDEALLPSVLFETPTVAALAQAVVEYTKCKTAGCQ